MWSSATWYQRRSRTTPTVFRIDLGVSSGGAVRHGGGQLFGCDNAKGLPWREPQQSIMSEFSATGVVTIRACGLGRPMVVTFVGGIGWRGGCCSSLEELVAADELVDSDLAASMFVRRDAACPHLTGDADLLPALVKEVLDRGLNAELDLHLGFSKYEVPVRSSGGSRNHSSPLLSSVTAEGSRRHLSRLAIMWRQITIIDRRCSWVMRLVLRSS